MLPILTQLIDLITKGTAPSAEPLTVPRPVPGFEAVTLVRDGYTLKEIPPRPARPVATHAFHDVPSFAAWLQRHADPQVTEIFADAGRKVIRANTSRQFTRDQVSCSLQPSQAWVDWTGILGKELSHKDLYRWLLAHRAHLDAAGPGSGTAVLNGLATLALVSSGKVESRMTERGTLEFVGQQQGRELQGKVPSSFAIVIPAWVGQPETYQLEIDIDIDTDDGITFELRAATLQDVALTAWLDQVAKLELLLNGPAVEGARPSDIDWLVSRGALSVMP